MFVLTFCPLHSRNPARMKVLLLLFGLCCSAAMAQAPLIDVRVVIDPVEPARVAVCARADIAQPLRLRARAGGAARYLRHSNAADLQRPEGLQAGDCLRYEVDILAQVQTRRSDVGYVVGGAWLSYADQWLWLPVGIARDRLRLQVELPPGWQMFAPLRPGQDGFQFGEWRDDQSDAIFAFGKMVRSTLGQPGARVEVAVLGELPAAQQKTLLDWVERGLSAVATLGAPLPLPVAHVLVVPIGAQRSAVRFGMVERIGVPTSYLFVDPSRPARDYADDWTLVHELSHFWHPPLELSARWLSEGLATYLQNVLRARTGLYRSEDALRRLAAGFERGRRGHSGLSVSDASAAMATNRAYMQVYWTGAAFWFHVDLQLRAHGSSLDAALKAAMAKLPHGETRLSGERFIAAIGQAGPVSLLPIYRHYAQRRSFPPTAPDFAKLGVVVNGRGVVVEEPDNALLRAIFAL